LRKVILMVEEKEDNVDGATEGTNGNATEEPKSRPSKEAHVYSVCGSTVVLEEFEASRGVRYRCPE